MLIDFPHLKLRPEVNPVLLYRQRQDKAFETKIIKNRLLFLIIAKWII